MVSNPLKTRELILETVSEPRSGAIEFADLELGDYSLAAYSVSHAWLQVLKSVHVTTQESHIMTIIEEVTDDRVENLLRALFHLLVSEVKHRANNFCLGPAE